MSLNGSEKRKRLEAAKVTNLLIATVRVADIIQGLKSGIWILTRRVSVWPSFKKSAEGTALLPCNSQCRLLYLSFPLPYLLSTSLAHVYHISCTPFSGKFSNQNPRFWTSLATRSSSAFLPRNLCSKILSPLPGAIATSSVLVLDLDRVEKEVGVMTRNLSRSLVRNGASFKLIHIAIKLVCPARASVSLAW